MGGALHTAARRGHGGVVNALLEGGASTAAKDRRGSTPLHLAAKEGITEIVQLLMLKGADKNALDIDEETPLFLAGRAGRVAASLALLATGADVNVLCGTGKRSAVFLAAQQGPVRILRAKVEHGADANECDLDEKFTSSCCIGSQQHGHDGCARGGRGQHRVTEYHRSCASSFFFNGRSP